MDPTSLKKKLSEKVVSGVTDNVITRTVSGTDVVEEDEPLLFAGPGQNPYIEMPLINVGKAADPSPVSLRQPRSPP